MNPLSSLAESEKLPNEILYSMNEIQILFHISEKKITRLRIIQKNLVVFFIVFECVCCACLNELNCESSAKGFMCK